MSQRACAKRQTHFFDILQRSKHHDGLVMDDEKERHLNHTANWLEIDISTQTMRLYAQQAIRHQYTISSAANGVGQGQGSYQTPSGWHIIRAKMGDNMPANTVFVARRPTGEIYSPALAAKYPNRDWILTRILWLSGCDPGKNRLHDVDTMRRYIYIHGSPDHVPFGQPGSKGCIRMQNQDIIQLFDAVSPGIKVLIKE